MKMKKRVNLWSSLPEELISLIITSSGLDSKSMIKCMLVCKQWRNLVSILISNPHLVAQGDGILVYNGRLPHRFGALDDETHQIALMKTFDLPWKPAIQVVMSSCNGLVCCLLSILNYEHIYIVNPMTGEHTTLPKHPNTINYTQYALGFCPIRNEYKLTMLRWRSIEIYTLGSPTGWRTVPCERPGRRGSAICVSGVLHWLLETRSILTFDLDKEVFGSIPIPLPDKEIYQFGCLDHCLVVTAGYDPCLGLEIWARKEDKSSVWTKNWVIDVDPTLNFKLLIPVKLSTGGRIIMTDQHSCLYSYDTRNKLGRVHKFARVLHAFYYTPTLVCPQKLMQLNGQERSKIEEK